MSEAEIVQIKGNKRQAKRAEHQAQQEAIALAHNPHCGLPCTGLAEYAAVVAPFYILSICPFLIAKSLKTTPGHQHRKQAHG
ncbi:MAG: hypothetical protein R2932_40440 [Caldilineaceae bacterium]